MHILTADKDLIPFTKDSKIRIKEIKHDQVLYGYNVELDNTILDTYENEEEAEEVSRFIYNNINQEKIDIEQLNKQLEIL